MSKTLLQSALIIFTIVALFSCTHRKHSCAAYNETLTADQRQLIAE